MFDCPVCGQPMVHYRTSGYRCIIERHNEMVREAEMRELALLRRHKIRAIMKRKNPQGGGLRKGKEYGNSGSVSV